MNNLREKEYNIIENELKAVKANISENLDIVINKNKYNKLYYIYVDTKEKIAKYENVLDYVTNENASHIYFTSTIEELKGWLYGVVQAKNNRI